ncbi:transposase family protein [Streptomyces sp. NPDC090026]|uniref:helix-turn-helix domain-containing protein n=1 Tax=Streptomyces sp. NPDC090026 TaxID=3365923 RepID=UPI0038107D8D
MFCVVRNRTRAATIRSQRITQQSRLTPDMIAELVAEVGPLCHERHQAMLVSRPRRRAVGAGAQHKLVFVDRLLATLVHLRHGATHDVLVCCFGVDHSTVTRAIGEVRPLLAEHGCTVAPGHRLRSLGRGAWSISADGPCVEVLTDAGYQGLGAQTGERAVTPPQRKPRRTHPSVTRKCTSARARPTPHAASGSSTTSAT